MVDNSEKKDVATVQISGITTGTETPVDQGAPFKPQRAGSMFARFIDDIFQVSNYYPLLSHDIVIISQWGFTPLFLH